MKTLKNAHLLISIFVWLVANVCAAFVILYALFYLFDWRLFAAMLAACAPLSCALLPLARWRVKYLLSGEKRGAVVNIIADLVAGFALGMAVALLLFSGGGFGNMFFEILAVGGAFGVMAVASFTWLLSRRICAACGGESANFCAFLSVAAANILALVFCLLFSGGFVVFFMGFYLAEIPYIIAVYAVSWLTLKLLYKTGITFVKSN